MNATFRLAVLGTVLAGLVCWASPGSACPLHRRPVQPVVTTAAAPSGVPADKEPAKTADQLKVPDGMVELFRLKTKNGVQIYNCQPKKDNPKEYEWVFQEPLADLLQDDGKMRGTHGRGPSWESVWPEDKGSGLTAELLPVASVSKEDAIPWLLLKVKAHTGKGEGKGRFDNVTYIQRIDTAGGKAPAKCGESYQGTELRVPYTATYVFYGPKQ
jgi:hypothetical protein